MGDDTITSVAIIQPASNRPQLFHSTRQYLWMNIYSCINVACNSWLVLTTAATMKHDINHKHKLAWRDADPKRPSGRMASRLLQQQFLVKSSQYDDSNLDHH